MNQMITIDGVLHVYIRADSPIHDRNPDLAKQTTYIVGLGFDPSGVFQSYP
jgi:hypothetical protein